MQSLKYLKLKIGKTIYYCFLVFRVYKIFESIKNIIFCQQQSKIFWNRLKQWKFLKIIGLSVSHKE